VAISRSGIERVLANAPCDGAADAGTWASQGFSARFTRTPSELVTPCDVRFRAGRPHIELLFFQAEDGIRDRNVTGVQTCALPIWCDRPRRGRDRDLGAGTDRSRRPDAGR